MCQVYFRLPENILPLKYSQGLFIYKFTVVFCIESETHFIDCNHIACPSLHTNKDSPEKLTGQLLVWWELVGNKHCKFKQKWNQNCVAPFSKASHLFLPRQYLLVVINMHDFSAKSPYPLCITEPGVLYIVILYHTEYCSRQKVSQVLLFLPSALQIMNIL